MSKSVAIIGLAESGMGAVLLAKKKGYRIFASDNGKIKTSDKKILSDLNVKWEEGSHTVEKILQFDEIVKSPGIDNQINLIKEAKKRKVSVISEIEFAYRHSSARVIAITGSNGKTTTSNLLYEILKQARYNVALAGNIGYSYSRLVAKNDPDYIVLETSSFQLEGISKFKPTIAILLNVTPDHLDRYNNDIVEYLDTKFNIIANQTVTDSFIYFQDDKMINKGISKRNVLATQYPFTKSKELKKGGSLINDQIIISLTKNILKMSVFELSLQGKHNAYNSMASAIAAQILGVKNEVIRESLSDFKNIEHRLESVLEINGVQYVNDSKATNVNATWYALESYNEPIIWICGGVDKGNDYKDLIPLVKEKVKAVVCLGKDNKKIITAFKNTIQTIESTSSMKEAVHASYKLANKGDVVLFSPSCASFDLYKNYEDRGRHFKEIIRKL